MKVIKRLTAFTIIAALLTASTLQQVKAMGEFDFVVNKDYMDYFQPIPKTYVLKDTVFYLGDEYGLMNAATDLTLSPDDHLFIADTGNNRIIELNEQLETVASYDNASEKMFRSPQSVHVDEDGAIFVADTENQRIVKLSKNGEFVEEFTKPNSSLLPEDFTFTPRKLNVSSTGYIYAIRHQWLMQVDAYNNFRGYIGATQVGFDFFYLVQRFFANEKQKIAMRKREPSSCLSFDIAENGALYITTAEPKGQLKKINSVGANIYPKDDFFGYYNYNEAGMQVLPSYIDVAVDKNEVIYMLEANEGNIHVYDNEGNNLAIFGGKGQSKDLFGNPVALDVDSKGNVYVIDSLVNCIKIFEPTRFMRATLDAVNLYTHGKYADAVEHWRIVTEIDSNFYLANKGIAKAYYKQGEWKKSMEYYLLCNDKVEYSRAFDKYRRDMLREHFTLIVLAGAAGIICLYFISKLYLKQAKKIIERYYGSI